MTDDDGTFLNSQRGDSGSISINMICVRAGTAATPNIHLHVPGAWTKIYQSYKMLVSLKIPVKPNPAPKSNFVVKIANPLYNAFF